MPAIPDEYRSTLIDQILFATSRDEIQTFIYAAIKVLYSARDKTVNF